MQMCVCSYRVNLVSYIVRCNIFKKYQNNTLIGMSLILQKVFGEENFI